MGPTMKDLGIDKLPADQRRALVGEILGSLDDAQAVPPLSDAMKAESERRDAEMDAHPERDDTWVEVRAQLGWRP